MTSEVNPHWVLGSVDRAAGIEMRDDLGDQAHGLVHRPARQREPRKTGYRLGRHRRAADVPVDRGRLAVAGSSVFGPVECRKGVPAGAEEAGPQVRIVQLLRRGACLIRKFDRIDRPVLQKRDMRHVAQQVRIGHTLADLARDAPAGLEQLEGGRIMSEHALGLAKVVDDAAFHCPVTERTSQVERLLKVTSRHAVPTTLKRHDAELRQSRALKTLLAEFACKCERLGDLVLGAGIVALELQGTRPVQAGLQSRAACAGRVGMRHGTRRCRAHAAVIAGNERMGCTQTCRACAVHAVEPLGERL